MSLGMINVVWLALLLKTCNHERTSIALCQPFDHDWIEKQHGDVRIVWHHNPHAERCMELK